MTRDFRHDTESEPNMRTSSPVSGLVGRLRDVAGPVRMNNGSFSCIAHEAAFTLTSLSTRNAELERGIDRLAAYIMENVPGEPSENQGAVDTALRLLGKNAELDREVNRLREAIRVKGGSEHYPTEWAYLQACEARDHWHALAVGDEDPDEPSSYRALAVGMLMDFERYAHDEHHARRIVSVEGYKEDIERLDAQRTLPTSPQGGEHGE